MSSMRGIVAALVVLLASGAVLSGDSLNGTWELEVLQSEDKLLRVEHKGNEFSAYRQLHPMFEGKRYLLEHLYKGKVSGQELAGDLLVREEPDDGVQLDFEVLRPFKGRILPGPVLVIDGKRARRVPDPPRKAGPPPVAPKPEAKAEPAPGSDGGPVTPKPKKDEPLDFSRLTPVAGPALEIPGIKAEPDLENPPQDRRNREFAKHLAAGDRHSARGAQAQALLEYLAAYKWDNRKVAVYSRIAGAAEKRGKLELAREFYRKLIRFDPENEHAHQRLKALGPEATGKEAQP